MDNYLLAMKLRSKKDVNNNIPNMTEAWSNATLETKTDTVMVECLMQQRNCSKYQAYQQLSNNKRMLDKLLDQNDSVKIKKIWDNFFQNQRQQIYVAFEIKKFILDKPGKTLPQVITQASSWFQQEPIPSFSLDQLRLSHLQEILNSWVNWKKTKQQLQGPLESLKVVFIHYQYPFPENFFVASPGSVGFGFNSFPSIRFYYEAALLWRHIASRNGFVEELWRNETFSTQSITNDYGSALLINWQRQQLLEQLFSPKALGNNTQATYFNGLAFRHATNLSFDELLSKQQLKKNSLYDALSLHEQTVLLTQKFDQIGESTQYRIGSLPHSLASILKRIHYYQHSDFPKHFSDVSALFLAFKQMEEQWQHKKNYPIHPRILLALHLAESNNVVIEGDAWQTKVKNSLQYLANKIKSDREARLILADQSSATKPPSTWLDQLESWAITVPVIGPLLTMEEGIRDKKPNEIISGVFFLGLDAYTLLYEEISATLENVAFSSTKLLKNVLFRERITVVNTRLTLDALKVTADDLFLQDSTLFHRPSPLELERSIAISQDARNLAHRVRSGEQGLKWSGYDLVYLHNEDRVVPIKPQGGSFCEIDWQSGEVNTKKHLIFKDNPSGKYFTNVGLRGGSPELELLESDLIRRDTVKKVMKIFALTIDYRILNFNELFASHFSIEKQSGASKFDALAFYRKVYEKSPNFRSLFNSFVAYENFQTAPRWSISIAHNLSSRTDFNTFTIHIGSDTEITKLYYMGTHGIACSQPEQVYLHEILHALTGDMDPKKNMAIANRGPIVYLTDKILSEVGYLFPQRLMYQRPHSNIEGVHSLELYLPRVRSFVAQENSYLDQRLNKPLKKNTLASLHVFNEVLADRYTIKELRSIAKKQPILPVEPNFTKLYNQAFSANYEDTHIRLRKFYLDFYLISTTFNKLYNDWESRRKKSKDNSRWHFVLDQRAASLTELPSNKRASCINALTHKIHIFDDGTLYLSDKGLNQVERGRMLIHQMVQLLTDLKDLPNNLASTNRGAVVRLTDAILNEVNLGLPKRLVSRLTLADDLKTKADLTANWLEAERAMQLEDSFINTIPELDTSCFPWCNRNDSAIVKKRSPAVQLTTTERLKNNGENSQEVKKKRSIYNKIEEESAYLTQYDQQQAKSTISQVQSQPESIKVEPTKQLQKQVYDKVKSISDKKHSTQHNKATSHLFKLATKPLTTQAQIKPSKRLLLPKMSSNTPFLFQSKEVKPLEKQLDITAAVTARLIAERHNHFYHQNASTGILPVTTTIDVNSTLFLVDTLVRAWTGNSTRR